ncbi:MAG: hypothetical protein J5654_08565 [Victivallales bacterium]|nr:hypothetical protein [Victivallales bacterium]
MCFTRRHNLLVKITFFLALGALGLLAATVDVRDFGAVGDGIADDTDAIQRTLDMAEQEESKFSAGCSELPPWGGHGGHGSSGLVFLPAGTYRLSRPLVFDRSHLLLRGEEGTTLVAAEGQDLLYLHCINRAIIENIQFQGGRIQLNVYTDNNDMSMIRVENCVFADAELESIRAFNAKAEEWRGVPPYLVHRADSGLPVLEKNPEYDFTPQLFPNSTIFTICHSRFQGSGTFIGGGSDQFVVENCDFHRIGGLLPIFHNSGQTNMRRIQCSYEAPVPGGPTEWMTREPYDGRQENYMGADVVCVEDSSFTCPPDAPLSFLHTSSKPNYCNSGIRILNSQFQLEGAPLLKFSPGSLVNLLDIRGNQLLDAQPAEVVSFGQIPTREEIEKKIRFKYYDVAPLELQFKFLIDGNAGFRETLPPVFQAFQCAPLPLNAIKETEVLKFPDDRWPTTDDFTGTILRPDFASHATEAQAIQAVCDQAKKGDIVLLPGRRITLHQPIRLSSGIALRGEGTALMVAAEPSMQSLVRIEGKGDTMLADLAFADAQIGVDIRSAGGRHVFRNCLFLDQRNTGIRADQSPSAILVTDSLFFSYGGLRTNATHTEIRRSWVCNHPLAEDTGFFENFGGELLAEYNLFVPILPRIDIGEYRSRAEYEDLRCENNLRWFDNHGGRLFLNCNRIGGEFGGMTPVYLYGHHATLRFQGSYNWFGNYYTRRCAVYCHDTPRRVAFQSVIFNLEGWLGPGAPYNVTGRNADTDLDIPMLVLPQIHASAILFYR